MISGVELTKDYEQHLKQPSAFVDDSLFDAVHVITIERKTDLKNNFFKALSLFPSSSTYQSCMLWGWRTALGGARCMAGLCSGCGREPRRPTGGEGRPSPPPGPETRQRSTDSYGETPQLCTRQTEQYRQSRLVHREQRELYRRSCYTSGSQASGRGTSGWCRRPQCRWRASPGRRPSPASWRRRRWCLEMPLREENTETENTNETDGKEKR